MSSCRLSVDSLLAVQIKDWANGRLESIDDLDIARFSKYTKDFHRFDSNGHTILDFLLHFNFGNIERKIGAIASLLGILAYNGIDVRAYCQREILLHPDERFNVQKWISCFYML